MLLFGFEAICFFFGPASHTYVDYLIDENKTLAKLLRLEELAMPASSTFVGNEYL